MATNAELALIQDIDLTSDDAWEPMFSPYHGKVVPAWKITQYARFRMGLPNTDRPND